MNTATTILALCCAAALPLLALEPQPAVQSPTAPAARSGAPDKQEWERRFLDRINDKLIWNAERSIAVGCIPIGASHYHCVYWCFRENAEGRIIPFACYSYKSDYAAPTDMHITAEGLEVVATMQGGRTIHCSFPFSQPRVTTDYSPHKVVTTTTETARGLNPLEDAPHYQDILDLDKE